MNNINMYVTLYAVQHISAPLLLTGLDEPLARAPRRAGGPDDDRWESVRAAPDRREAAARLLLHWPGRVSPGRRRRSGPRCPRGAWALTLPGGLPLHEPGRLPGGGYDRATDPHRRPYTLRGPGATPAAVGRGVDALSALAGGLPIPGWLCGQDNALWPRAGCRVDLVSRGHGGERGAVAFLLRAGVLCRNSLPASP